MEQTDIMQYLLFATQLEQDVFTLRQTMERIEQKIHTLGIPHTASEMYYGTDLYSVGRSRMFTARRASIFCFGIAIFFFLLGGILLIASHMKTPGAVLLVVGVLFAISGSICFESSQKALRSKKKRRQERQKQSHEMERLRLQKESVMKAHLEMARNMLKQRTDAAQKEVAHLYQEGILHPKYQNLAAVATLHEYLTTGRCTHLFGPDGAYEKYEAETRKAVVYNRLSDAIFHLKQTEQTQFELYQAIKQAARETDLLYGYATSEEPDKGIANMQAYIDRQQARHAQIAAWSASLSATVH